MLAKQPDDRYQTPAEVAAALASFAVGGANQAAPSQQEERRSSTRHACKFPVVCRLLHSIPEVHWEAEVQNVSRGGLALRSSREARHGVIVAVEWQSPGGTKTTRRLRVVHADSDATSGYWRIGCAFSKGLTADELRSLQGEQKASKPA
jgi:hypothetical protein